ncbi:hypothetical protein M378DRAFT_641515 [Amanita muscaria Koide BX008]|uniref:Uncharacterized protein n=1 Tax=Amanita muscaria (strain Koide BX008) TaxID=946122 RepID=A0A0C2TBC9_AMAMK|nr:hypothetical protein M378DRAFT_641515 [Amanita muscaria Koide BX008]
MRLATSYIPHALYAIAVTSISIHLVSKRRTFEDERANVNARISILESIAEQLRSGKPINDDEVERLKRLARDPVKRDEEAMKSKSEEISWKEVFLGQKSQSDSDLSPWEKKDLEKIQKAANES